MVSTTQSQSNPVVGGGTTTTTSTNTQSTIVPSLEERLQDAYRTERAIDEELEKLVSLRGSGDVMEACVSELKDKTLDRIRLALGGIQRLGVSTKETAELADVVSCKIREVDMKQSRVREVLRRIDAIGDRSKAVDGCRRALEVDDVGVAVGCVSRFMDILQEEEEQGMVACRQDDDEDMQQREVMKRYSSRVTERVREKAMRAVEEKDHDGVTMYVAMYGPLRLEKEGVELLVEYVSGLIDGRAQEEYDALVDGFSLSGSKVTFVDAVSNVLKDVAQSVNEYVDMMRESFGPEYALEGVHGLHHVCDVRGTRVLKRYIEDKGLSRLCQQMSNRIDASNSPNDNVFRTIEPMLMELLVLCTRGEEYIQFILQAMADAAAPNTLSPSLETSIRGGAFGSCLREVLSYYISLEEYYVEESVAKAIEICEAVPGSLTSSMVDDSFYVLLSSGKRALSTGRAPSAVAILNQINTVIATVYRSSLVKKLQGCSSRLAGCAPKGYQEQYDSRADEYALAMNDVALSAAYVEKLRGQLEQVAHHVFVSSPHDEDRIRLVLADLNKTAADIQRLSDQSCEQLTTSLMSKLRPVLDAFVAARYELSEDVELNDEWSISLIQAFEQAFIWLQNVISSEVYTKVIDMAVDKIIARMEACIAQKQFSQLGGLQLEKDVRSLVIGLSDLTQTSMRDKFSRLQQLATVLGVETAAEAADLVGDALLVSWKLTSLDVRQALAQRIDFSQHDIAAVKLHL